MGRLRLNPISAFIAHPKHVVMTGRPGETQAGGGGYAQGEGKDGLKLLNERKGESIKRMSATKRGGKKMQRRLLGSCDAGGHACTMEHARQGMLKTNLLMHPSAHKHTPLLIPLSFSPSLWLTGYK